MKRETTPTIEDLNWLRELPVSWRPMSWDEREALLIVAYGTDGSRARLRSRIIDAVISRAADRSPVDLVMALWTATGFVYSRDMIARDNSHPAPSLLFAAGMVGLAGNVPELLTDAGLDPKSLSCWVSCCNFTDFRTWPAELSNGAQGRKAVLLRRTFDRAITALRPALRRYAEWYEAESGRSTWTAGLHHEIVAGLEIDASMHADRQSLLRLAAKLGDRDILNSEHDAEDAIQELWIRAFSPDGPGDPVEPLYFGRDGAWHLNCKEALDAQRLGRRHRRRDHNGKLQPLKPVALGETPVPENAADPSEIAVARDLIAKAATILIAAAVDEVDRQDVRLILQGELNRSTRAKTIECAEGTLRHREGRLLRATETAAPEEVRPLIRKLLAG